MLRTVLGASVALAAMWGPAPAAEIGRTQIDGETIVIEDDFTWHYPVACTKAEFFESAQARIAYCVSAASWEAATPETGHELTFYSQDGNFGLALINEQPGTTVAGLRQLILDNASAASIGAPIEILAEYEVKVSGRTWQLIEFKVTLEDSAFHFVNAYATADDYGSSQIALWTMPENVDELYDRANELLNGVSFPAE